MEGPYSLCMVAWTSM